MVIFRKVFFSNLSVFERTSCLGVGKFFVFRGIFRNRNFVWEVEVEGWDKFSFDFSGKGVFLKFWGYGRFTEGIRS